ncbi:hypothetical protein B0T17DRAFT_504747 [Bombardia bombarda]|uniref:Uncharacterized protein n=1 Tax=Bombardia bombarda TaxID=252184 RepID=A0AA40CH72_9PEZI|nr:hypothetical protein B0T17DRAFT_504747 [Bombardia bombarda]
MSHAICSRFSVGEQGNSKKHPYAQRPRVPEGGAIHTQATLGLKDNVDTLSNTAIGMNSRENAGLKCRVRAGISRVKKQWVSRSGGGGWDKEWRAGFRLGHNERRDILLSRVRLAVLRAPSSPGRRSLAFVACWSSSFATAMTLTQQPSSQPSLGFPRAGKLSCKTLASGVRPRRYQESQYKHDT